MSLILSSSKFEFETIASSVILLVVNISLEICMICKVYFAKPKPTIRPLVLWFTIIYYILTILWASFTLIGIIIYNGWNKSETQNYIIFNISSIIYGILTFLSFFATYMYCVMRLYITFKEFCL